MDFTGFGYEEGCDDAQADGFEDGHEEGYEQAVEDIEDESEEGSLDEEIVFEPGLREAAAAGALLGAGEERGEQIAEEKKLIDESAPKERPAGAKPISKFFKKKKRKKDLPPFEQWVADLITGRKTMDDEL